MRTLFLFDTHVIRQDPWSCRQHLRELFSAVDGFSACPSLWAGLEPKVLLTKFKTTAPAPCVIRLPIDAERALRSFATAWDEQAIRAWCGLMRDDGPVAEIYRDILQHLVSQHGIECFAYWGSNNTIRNFCDSCGLKSVALELGPTRRPFRETRYCDFLGVNGDAHVRLLDWRRFKPLDLDLWRRQGGIRYDDGSRDDARRRPLTSRYAKFIYRSSKPCALVALQLDDDANCLVHSNFSGMREMIGEAVPALVSAGWRVFVKPHPGAAPERNQGGARICNVLAHEACRSYLAENFSEEEAIWLDDVPSEQYVSLLDKIDALVSVNSSMGFEAMLAGKVVVSLGVAPYNVGGGLPSLADLVRGDIDPTAYADYSARACRALVDYYLQPADLLSSPTTLSRSVLRNALLSEAWRKGGAEGLTDAVLANPVNLQ